MCSLALQFQKLAKRSFNSNKCAKKSMSIRAVKNWIEMSHVCHVLLKLTKIVYHVPSIRGVLGIMGNICNLNFTFLISFTAPTHSVTEDEGEEKEMKTSFNKRRKKKGHMSAGHDCIGKHREHPEGQGNTVACTTTASSSRSTTMITLAMSTCTTFTSTAISSIAPLSTSISLGPWLPR